MARERTRAGSRPGVGDGPQGRRVDHARVLELAAVPGEGITADAVAGEPGTTASPAPLTWLQREALRIRAAHGEVRRADLVARCRVSHELTRRALAGLVRLGLLRRVGLARATRYVSLSFWLTFLDDAAELVLTLV